MKEIQITYYHVTDSINSSLLRGYCTSASSGTLPVCVCVSFQSHSEVRSVQANEVERLEQVFQKKEYSNWMAIYIAYHLGFMHWNMRDHAKTLQYLSIFFREAQDNGIIIYYTWDVVRLASWSVELGQHSTAVQLFDMVLSASKQLFGDDSHPVRELTAEIEAIISPLCVNVRGK